MKKTSFFARLTGTGDEYAYSDLSETENSSEEVATRRGRSTESEIAASDSDELSVDVYQTPDAIVLKALIAGIQPNSIDISLTRDMITISGTRHDEHEVEEEHYFQRELYWGSFSRTILLPEEVDVDAAEASEKHGVLQIRLPKINKKKEAKIKVRTR